MKAMVLKQITSLETNSEPLQLVNLPIPVPREKEILIKISACGVCHTELDEIEGRTPPPSFPTILGHQVIGRVEENGPRAHKFKIGDRVGVGWIGFACGNCEFCLGGNENLCNDFMATGRDLPGGYAEYMTIKEDFAYPIPSIFADAEAAPLLCAGAIGYRALRLSGISPGKNLGLIGFGASAHLVIQMAKYKFPAAQIFVFARSTQERSFARQLGAIWAGDIGEEPPEKIDCAIDTTPAWRPVMAGLKNLQKSGRLVINAIRKEERDKETLQEIDYPAHLWLEKEIKSVANVTRQDIEEFLHLAAQIPIKPEFQEFPLADANQALLELKQRKIKGAKVLRIPN
ncbi:MAG: zinc-dependent alcohol dehydrogenase family protein [Thermodesulfobacteriota bacterium]